MREAQVKTLTILHTNDIHGRNRSFKVVRGSATSQTGDPGQDWHEYSSEGWVGGFPALSTAVNRFRQERGPENVLLVDGGDTFSDDLLGNLTQGEAVVRLMNALGYQLMALGNHDFDYGIERTRQLEKIGGFPMRAANVIERATGQPFLGDPTLVLEAGGLKVGFLTLGYHNSGLTGNQKNHEPLMFIDGVEAARRYLPGLRERSDLIIVLSHQGTAMDRILAKKVPMMDLIIGSHSHDQIENEKVGAVAITQAVSDASVLGETLIQVESGKAIKIENHLHTLWNEKYPDDPEISHLLMDIRRPHQSELEEVIGLVASPIWRNYRSESPFDRLAGEMMCHELDTEIAFLPGVGYGVTLLPGPLTRETLYTLLPHPAKVVTMKMTGDQVLEILEQSATNQAPENPAKIVGGLVQTAGLKWTVNYNLPSGQRISDVSVRGQAIEKERYYRVATNSGMLNGLHNYHAFSKGRNIKTHNRRLNILIEAAIRKVGALEPPPAGSIKLVHKG
jgi:5'-nucleotidase / UDP-sugar diphosphatase